MIAKYPPDAAGTSWENKTTLMTGGSTSTTHLANTILSVTGKGFVHAIMNQVSINGGFVLEIDGTKYTFTLPGYMPVSLLMRFQTNAVVSSDTALAKVHYSLD